MGLGLDFILRRFGKFGDGARSLRGTAFESLAVAQIEPPNVEMSRAARRFFIGNSAAVTGIAPATALVTTAAQWVLWNNSDRYTMWMEELGMYLTSGTPGVGGVLWGALISAPAQTGSSVAGVTVSGAASVFGVDSAELIVKTGVTVTTPAAPNWFHLAENSSPNVTAFAASTFLSNRTLAGAIGIAPNRGLALAVVAPAGTSPLFAPFGRFVMMDTDNE